MHPKVSIIIPLYNRETVIKDTLISLSSQSYPTWEAIIVDDGSSDQSCAVVAEYIKIEPRIKLFERNRLPKGAPTCRNIGLGLARGAYIIFLDSDDILAPYCLEKRIQSIKKHPELDFMVFPMLIFKDKPGDLPLLWSDYRGNDAINEFISMRTPWQTTGPIWKKSALMQVNGWWDESVSTWQDWEYHIRISLSGLRYKVVEDLPDCFLRRDDHERISASDMKPERLQAKLILFEKVLTLLECKMKLTPEVKKAFARLIFQHAERSAILYPNESFSLSFLQQVQQWSLLLPNQVRLITNYIKYLSFAKKNKLPLIASIGYKLAHKVLPKSLLADKYISKASVTSEVLNQVNVLLYGSHK